MTRNLQKIFSPGLGLCLAAFLLLALAAITAAASAASSGEMQRLFSSPEEARQALLNAVKAKDHMALKAIFGPVTQELEPGDPVEQANEFEHFARHVDEGVELVREGDAKAELLIGAKKWPFPVPIVKKGNGWLFDTVAGRDEILKRRIGHNELLAVQVCRAYAAAQREYYSMAEPDGVQLPKYARHMISRAGRRDGLYWQSSPGEKESPLGLLVAQAKEEGYMKPRQPGEKGPRPFHGYFFKILDKQGPNAPGGKFDYVINGNMVAGFALVAYPARWGVSGVMTFIINQRGRVYQKNLGPKTGETAGRMKQYNPDLTWKLVAEQ
ncbi:MAG TPA: DUF2950 domain-containing protein [Geobacteraceae bacterium]|nr:DUF2950 domain-containing protein [Geobacteraceae bacterium]